MSNPASPDLQMAALQGVTASGEPLVIIALENPVQVIAGSLPLDKEVLERLQLERFRGDFLLHEGRLPFDEVRRGVDPPDFIVQTIGGEERLDCAALAFQQRRLAHKLFFSLRRRIAETNPSDYPGIRDCLLGIWFGRGTDTPPKQTDRTILDSLLKAMRECTVDRAFTEAFVAQVQEQGWPDQLPLGSLPQITAEDGRSGFFASPIQPGSIAGDFYSEFGFDLHLQMSFHVAVSDLQTEVDRLVKKHDKGRADHLLLSVGSPDRYGLRYPGEDIVMQLVPYVSVQPRHLRAVTVHGIATGQIMRLATTIPS